jgi:protein ImuB
VRRAPPLPRKTLSIKPGGAWPDTLPRPPRLLIPPRPVETVALLPDHPPVQFTWRRKPHRIRRADGPERVFGEWWRSDDEVFAVRDYFQLEDEAGQRFWLFRKGDGQDRATGDLTWFLHGLFA